MCIVSGLWCSPTQPVDVYVLVHVEHRDLRVSELCGVLTERVGGVCVCVEGSLLKSTRPDWVLRLINYAEQALEELRDRSSRTFSLSREYYYGNRAPIREPSTNYGKEEQASSDLVCQAAVHL